MKRNTYKQLAALKEEAKYGKQYADMSWVTSIKKDLTKYLNKINEQLKNKEEA